MTVYKSPADSFPSAFMQQKTSLQRFELLYSDKLKSNMDNFIQTLVKFSVMVKKLQILVASIRFFSGLRNILGRHTFGNKKLGVTDKVTPLYREKYTFSPSSDKDAAFWNHSVGMPLAILLKAAKYSRVSQEKHIEFFTRICTPSLGKMPSHSGQLSSWKSFMTDNHCPVELSWDWGWNNANPAVRYSIEPIGSKAGQGGDTLNKKASETLINQLRQDECLESVDLIRHFSDHLLEFDEKVCSISTNHGNHNSQLFAAFDLSENDILPKIYFIPDVKARETQSTNLDLISESMRQLPNYEVTLCPAYEILEEFIKAGSLGVPIHTEIFAIDCVPLEHARYKIYVRCRSTNFRHVQDVVTLGGRLSSDTINMSLTQLHRLWKLLFPDSSSSIDQELEENDHRTAGILYNFEIRPGREISVPKVYLPVRHYSRSDQHVTDAIKSFMIESKGWDHENPSLRAYDKFLSSIQWVFPFLSFGSRHTKIIIGIQTSFRRTVVSTHILVAL